MPCPRRPAWLPPFLALLAAALSGGIGRGAEKPLRQIIDAEVRAAWEREKVTPAKPATDAEFLRRVYLDLAGSIPTYEETVAFLDSKEPAKREQLIDRLLADPRFAQHQADVWDLVLFGRHPPGYDTQVRPGFQAWLRGRFEKNIPYDVWVRELLRAEGNSVENAALYYAQYRNAPEDASEAISQTFLGVQLQCARCHDHPFESWTQRDFYGMAAFLARLQVVTVGRKGQAAMYAIGERSSGDIQFTGPAKDARPGQKGEPVKPKFLLGAELTEPALPAGLKEVKLVDNQPPPKPPFSRKDQLADWITRADNPFFARAVANRVWAQYLGRGLVHPVDNMSPAKKPTHPELLEQLGRALVEHKFDLKWYIRELVTSQTYQLSAEGTGEATPLWFPHARTRPLSAEELAEAWRIATGYADVEKASGKKPGDDRFRPLQGTYVLQFFGSPANGKGEFQGGLHENLYLNNGPLLQMIAGGKGNLVEAITDKQKPAAARAERLFLTTLNRRPTAAEVDKFTGFLGDNMAATDAVWALITSSEFRFNH
jgi:hypothetical protein